MKSLLIGSLLFSLALPSWSQDPGSANTQASKRPSLLPRTCKMEDYPAEAKRRNAQGTTRVRLTITIDGEVRKLTVIRSSGHEDLDAATVKLLSSCRGSPGEKDGKPTEEALELEYIWKLE